MCPINARPCTARAQRYDVRAAALIVIELLYSIFNNCCCTAVVVSAVQHGHYPMISYHTW